MALKVCNVPVNNLLNTPICEVCITEIYDGIYNVKGEIGESFADVNMFAKNKADVDGLISTSMDCGIKLEEVCSNLGILVEANI